MLSGSRPGRRGNVLFTLPAIQTASKLTARKAKEIQANKTGLVHVVGQSFCFKRAQQMHHHLVGRQL